MDKHNSSLGLFNI